MEFANRKAAVDAAAHDEREEKRAQRGHHRHGPSRGDGEDEALAQQREEEEKAWTTDFDMDDYEPFMAKNTQFFTTGKDHEVFRTVLDGLDGAFDKKFEVKHCLPKNKWRVKFEIPNGKDPAIEVNVNILRVDDRHSCVEF